MFPKRTLELAAKATSDLEFLLATDQEPQEIGLHKSTMLSIKGDMDQPNSGSTVGLTPHVSGQLLSDST